LSARIYWSMPEEMKPPDAAAWETLIQDFHEGRVGIVRIDLGLRCGLDVEERLWRVGLARAKASEGRLGVAYDTRESLTNLLRTAGFPVVD